MGKWYQVQYFNFQEGHEFAGQTGVALGNFDSGLNFVDMLSTNSIFSKDQLHSTDNIVSYYTNTLSSVGIFTSTNPLTHQTNTIINAEKGIEENNIIFDVITLAGAFKSIFNIFKSVPKDGRIIKGASKSVHYFTDKATKLGYSSVLTGAKVKAGVFVQIHHNVGRLLQGRGLKVLYSNSAASAVGREMLNNAYKGAGMKLIIGGTSTYNDFGN